MNVKNKCGYTLIEFISCKENEIEKYGNITSAGVVVKVSDKYLIGFNNLRKQWEIPAGRIESGEKPREAAERELLEETHQIVKNIEFVGLFKKKRPDNETVYSAIYRAEISHINPFIKQDDDENDDIKLWNLEEEIGYIDEVDLEIIKTVKNVVNKME